MPTLIEEMKPVVLVKHEFEYREKLKLMFPLEVLDYQNTDSREENHVLLVEFRLKVLYFRLNLWWSQSNWW